MELSKDALKLKRKLEKIKKKKVIDEMNGDNVGFLLVQNKMSEQHTTITLCQRRKYFLNIFNSYEIFQSFLILN